MFHAYINRTPEGRVIAVTVKPQSDPAKAEWIAQDLADVARKHGFTDAEHNLRAWANNMSELAQPEPFREPTNTE